MPPISLYISIYLYISLYISIYLYISLYISIYLYISLYISIYLYISLYISIYLYISLYISYIYYKVTFLLATGGLWCNHNVYNLLNFSGIPSQNVLYFTTGIEELAKWNATPTGNQASIFTYMTRDTYTGTHVSMKCRLTLLSSWDRHVAVRNFFQRSLCLCPCPCMHNHSIERMCGSRRLKGWMRQIFMADQNQHVSKPTWVKSQCNRHSGSALKSVSKMAKLARSEKLFKKAESNQPFMWRVISQVWWLVNARHLKLGILYLALHLQRVSQYLGQLITTDTFLRLDTSAETGSRVASLAPGLSKQAQREPRLADIARESQGMYVTCYIDHAKG